MNRSICPFINLQKQSSKQKDLFLAQSQMTSGKIAMVKQAMLQN
ncbi:hypothetical protein ECP030230811_1012 [Escherichia coli P0302308.11]|nr:hypothetical protein CSC39_3620 [Escherichia coli]EMX09136.1 hypothetical protein ECP03023081_1503 [Escherichia coli P0302308.1]ENC93639.1 hypothetical protein ECP030230810_5247 [Escherichia coli P0302308.10]END04985.1 hypothetical protein ECP030230811_1012 [Escherichia coli P0302308.11]END13362.1 hypothetical protein ECP03023083_1001 [Escherichia coli P0302308.3]END16699.1 hypothetical protein ECP03023082_1067 [Escherichia coli P0302308.2]END23926.1 hypothetical protein ECP03023085_1008 [